MTGPEHYQKAEDLLDQMHTVAPEFAAYLVAEAQVHATLALAAATAEPIAQAYDGDYDKAIPAAWSGAIS